jgi:hypothetical protein
LPDLETLRRERAEVPVRHLLTVRDAAGAVVRRLEVDGTAGMHRAAWDLRYPDFEPVQLEVPTDLPPWYSPPVGPLAPPGTYSVQLSRVSGGVESPLGEARTFDVRAIFEASLTSNEPAQTLTFARETGELYQRATAASLELRRAETRLAHLEKAIVEGPDVELQLLEQVQALRQAMLRLELDLVGDAVLQELEEPSRPSILGRLQTVLEGQGSTRHGPTLTHRESVEVARASYAAIEPLIRSLIEEELPEVERRAAEQGARWTPGRRLDG